MSKYQCQKKGCAWVVTDKEKQFNDPPICPRCGDRKFKHWTGRKKSDFKKMLGAIFDSIIGNAEVESESLPLFQFLLERINCFKDPEDFNLKVASVFETVVEQVFKKLHNTKSEFATFVFVEAGFIEDHVRNLTKQIEGWVCSADRSRHIARSSLKWALSGDIPSFKGGEKEYWIPRKGAGEQWMKFIKSLHKLKYGNPLDYLSSYQELIVLKNDLITDTSSSN